MLKMSELKKDFPNIQMVRDIPIKCSSCGVNLIINHSIENLKCPNDECPEKIYQQIENICVKLGIEEMSKENCIEFINKFEVNNPYVLFLYNPRVDGNISKGIGKKKSSEIYKKINYSRAMLLSSFIKLGGFDILSDYSNIIFKNYYDFKRLKLEINKGKIDFINNILLEKTELSKEVILVESIKIYELFKKHETDIEKGLKGVVLLKPKIKMPLYFLSDEFNEKAKHETILRLNNKNKNAHYFEVDYIDEEVVIVTKEALEDEFYSLIKEQYSKNKVVDVKWLI